jgi:rhamnosyltransferase
MRETEPLISVIIPVKNGDAWLDRTIPAILGQKLASPFEIIVIDSGSTDNSLTLLAGYPVNIVSIDPTEFNHGGTRNRGARLSNAKYVVMTVQDAEPADEYWLQNLLAGFTDETVAGVCGQQIVPHDPDKNPVDWFRPLSAPGRRAYRFSDPADFNALPAAEKRSICSWDNVNAMYRRDILLELPFPAVSFAEDALWAKAALLAGHTIVYNTAARVKHYHFETPDYLFRRTFTVSYHLFNYFGVTPSPVDNGVIQLLRNIKLLLKEKRVGWTDKWKWLRFNYRQRTAYNRSVRAFRRALAEGESALERKHSDLCGLVPQAIKPPASTQKIS